MKVQGKIKRKTKKKSLIWEVDESIKKFFPPISRMGNDTPSHWKQIEPRSFQRTVKAPL